MKHLHITIKITAIIIVLILLLNTIQIIKGSYYPVPMPEDNFFGQVEQPVNVAHRGASGKAPENTIIAFEKATKKGADALELDVWLTKDDIPVAIHDETVDRTTDGEGKVRSFTLEELQEWDAGYGIKSNGKYPFKDQGVIIPTLDEVLSEFPNKPIVVELKKEGEKSAQAVAEVISDHNAQERVLVASMNTNTVKELRNHLPNTRLWLALERSYNFIFSLI
ncbi:glycerophosphodiester phosphodiesterase family protein [Natranaerobius thermophilus]|uniref:glycerophosphodiester phosphodiesterase family protein n=1 Tax=Natranaerobius thermophilus TaxID=375929 RepID=UPI000166926D|nr:glycerophosphodiester phosphodiesterase family protein [Natranaerobius thermophilus]